MNNILTSSFLRLTSASPSPTNKRKLCRTCPEVKTDVGVGSAKDTYKHLIEKGYVKSIKFELQLFISAILAGFIIGAYGHCCTLGGSKLLGLGPWSSKDKGSAAIFYSIYFTGAFQAIIMTGSDLFTSNLLYGLCYLSDFSAIDCHVASNPKYIIRFIQTIKQWIICYLGNFLGTVMAALLFTLGARHFTKGSPPHEYICDMAEHKLHGAFLPTTADGIGANFFVGVATIILNTVHDGIGVLFCVMLPVMAFCVAGFQHSIANMYTLEASFFVGCEGLTQHEIWLKNILPSTLGNFLASVLLTIILYLSNSDTVLRLCMRPSTNKIKSELLNPGSLEMQTGVLSSSDSPNLISTEDEKAP